MVRRERTGNGAVAAMTTGDGRPWETAGMSAGPTAGDGYRASSLPCLDRGEVVAPLLGNIYPAAVLRGTSQ